MSRRILVLFPDEWDRLAAEDPRYRGRFEFVFEGFDLFRFPENVRLFTFDALRFVDDLCRRYGGVRPGGGGASGGEVGAFFAGAGCGRVRPAAPPRGARPPTPRQ